MTGQHIAALIGLAIFLAGLCGLGFIAAWWAVHDRDGWGWLILLMFLMACSSSIKIGAAP